ncbi:hypothetical protein Glove_364g51 [Diversispora epigaea]|uniref:hydroxyacylglutathione hydrolase n=1 Tax=Diversispora epigaea TaxID=1348612 RepID=A0A397H9C4_9GLOM|nr:hypothetical protein Glove_364g51 [Diversispora epigaea]
MRIITIPIFENNYSYLIVDDKTNEAAAVDPAEPQKVLTALAQTGARLTSVLTTNHHQHHSVGNIDLIKEKPNLAIFGHDARIPELNYVCKHEEEFTVGTLKVRSLHTPSYTKGSVCYYVRDFNEMNDEIERVLFTGDTLLTGGCGKFIEGDAKDMHNVLYNILGTLPKDTKVYCGHEYGMSNLQFANTIDPNNQNIRRKLAWLQAADRTVPSTIGDELECNPYLRISELPIQNATGTLDPYESIQMLRALNDNFNIQNNGINNLNGSLGINNCVNEFSNGMNVDRMNGVNVMNIMNGLSNLVM